MAKNKTDKIRVSFIGENAEHVTGSCTHIQMDNKQILLECGLYQSTSSVLHNYRINSAPLPFKPKAIDYIFVGHTHIDHIGKIPYLYQTLRKATAFRHGDIRHTLFPRQLGYRFAVYSE